MALGCANFSNVSLYCEEKGENRYSEIFMCFFKEC